ncbi:MAG: tetratricopeptide repeat protein [Cyanobacteria bacterium P01_F01_bin.153]
MLILLGVELLRLEFFELLERQRSPRLQQNTDQVLKHTRPAIATEDVKGWEELGDRQRRASLYAQALESYRRGLVAQPDNDGLWGDCAYCYSQLGQQQAALKAYRKSIQLGGAGKSLPWINAIYGLMELGWYDDALAMTDSALESLPDENSCDTIWEYRGKILNHFRRYEEALDSYDRAMELGSPGARTWLERGKALVQLNRHGEAIASYDEGLERNPNHPQLWRARGQVLEALRRTDEAAESYAHATPRAIAEEHYATGKAIYQIGLPGEALIHLDQAIAADPNWSQPWSMRGTVLDHWGRKLAVLNEKELAQEKWSAALDGWAQALKRCQNRRSAGEAHYDQACGYAVRGIKTKATFNLYIASLKMGLSEFCPLANRDSDLDTLRGSSRLLKTLCNGDRS